MSTTILEEMKAYVGFDDRDAEALRALAPAIEPYLPAVVDRFYEEILRHPGTRSVLAGGEAQVARLRGHLLNWLKTLFGGTYDAGYAHQRAVIGHVHVRVGLPQHHMFTAMEVLREELDRCIRRSGVGAVAAKRRSLHKLLAIETGMILQSYKVSYSERIRSLERQAMEERVKRAERLAEIGQLAASLAHEIKNPLAGISGAIQVIREDLAQNDPHKEVLDEIIRQINRLDGTVKDLLTYARPRALRFKSCRLSSTIERVAGLMRQEPAFAGLTLECEDCADLAPVDIDEHQIEQLLVNLLLNAAHASTSGDSVQLRVAADGHETAIVIQDRGHGMEEQTLRLAFDPFFTTKARGTGLGLPICQRIVDAHGGSIRLNSELGRGTVVEVRLPVHQAGTENGEPQ